MGPETASEAEPKAPDNVDLGAIAEHLSQLDEAEREIHAESSASLAEWLVRTYQMAMAQASRIAPQIQEMLVTMGLG